MRSPAAFAHGMRHPGGGEWQVSDDVWPRNPRHLVPRAVFHVARLWSRCRSGMGGFAALPEAGGINDQPAWLMAAFGVLDGAEEKLREAESGKGGGG